MSYCRPPVRITYVLSCRQYAFSLVCNLYFVPLEKITGCSHTIPLCTGPNPQSSERSLAKQLPLVPFRKAKSRYPIPIHVSSPHTLPFPNVPSPHPTHFPKSAGPTHAFPKGYNHRSLGSAVSTPPPPPQRNMTIPHPTLFPSVSRPNSHFPRATNP